MREIIAAISCYTMIPQTFPKRKKGKISPVKERV